VVNLLVERRFRADDRRKLVNNLDVCGQGSIRGRVILSGGRYLSETAHVVGAEDYDQLDIAEVKFRRFPQSGVGLVTSIVIDVRAEHARQIATCCLRLRRRNEADVFCDRLSQRFRLVWIDRAGVRGRSKIGVSVGVY